MGDQYIFKFYRSVLLTGKLDGSSGKIVEKIKLYNYKCFALSL